ncbi:uncharacterized protein LOC144661172 isoform X2 [Oculina patagonica]
MDDRPGSPEIERVSDGDRSGVFRYQSERILTSSGRNASNLRAANQNGGNRVAANTNTKLKNKVETVNLRVRNMGKIIVKKEPESDEDCEVSYSLSSLLEECDFEKAPTKKSRALKSPTSLAMARSKSLEASRPVAGRPRQSLENVISSLKSARAVNTSQPKTTRAASNIQNPVVPISMPSQIASTAPTPQKTYSMPISVATGAGPQIIDVRSLATGAQTALGSTTKRITRSATSKPVAPSTLVTTIRATVPQMQAPTAAKPVGSSVPKPLNIRFVLPATEPFNNSEFQQVLQTALASVISQSKGIEASLLQQAIQSALASVTKWSLPLNANQLQQAILSSLAALGGTTQTLQAPGVRLPQTTQIQPQATMPVQTPSQPAASSSIVNGGSRLTSDMNTSSPASLNQSPLNSARNALIKALQDKPVLNSPTSLSSSTLSSTSEVSTPPTADADYFDEPCSGSPPSSPVLPTPEALSLNSAGIMKSTTPTTAKSNTTGAVKPVPQKGTIPSNTSTPSIVLSSGTYLKSNQSPVQSGTQTALRSVPMQLLSSQGSPAAVPVSSALTPGNVTLNFPINPTVQSAGAPIPASKKPQAIAPAQIVQFSLFPASSQNMPVSKPNNNVRIVCAAQTQTGPIYGCGGGCCQYCRQCHENNNRCGLPSCQKTYPSRAGLRKHYHFNPTHRPSVPLERATTACDNFLPLELSDSHRRARLRELFRRLPDEELQELIKPRLTKIMSLFQLLEQKSLRASLGTVSAFKMFTEFERFKKEVEAKLLELILLPQGKTQVVSTNTSGVSSKDGSKPVDVKSSQSTTEAAKQSSKDSMPSATVKPDEKKESSTTQAKPDANSTVGSSATAKKTVETICIDSDVEMSAAKAKATGASSQSVSQESLSTCNQDPKGDVTSTGATDSGTLTVEDKKAGEPPSVEAKATELAKESGDAAQSSTPTSATVPSGESLPSKDGESKEGEKKDDELPKQSSSSAQSIDVSENAASLSKSSADKPPETEQPKQTEMAGQISGEPTPKDPTSVPMEVDEQPAKPVSAADSKPSESQSSDVIMVDSQKETESCSKDKELKSSKGEQVKESQNGAVEKADVNKEATVCNVEEDKPVVCTGEESQSVEVSGEDKTTMSDKEQNEKPPNLVDKESKTAVDEAAEKDSETTKKDVDKSADVAQENKMAEKPAEEGKEIAAMDVEEQGYKSKTNSEGSQVKDTAEEKTDEAEAKAEEAKSSSDQDGAVKAGGKDTKASMDPEKQIKDDQQEKAVENKAGEAQKGGRAEIIDVDSGGDVAPASSSQGTPEVAMETDKVEVDSSKEGDQGSKDASKEKTSQDEGEQGKEVPKSSDKDNEANADSTKLNESQDPCTASDKGKESAKASSSEEASSSSDTTGSSDATSAGNSNSTAQEGSDSTVEKKKRIRLEDLDLGDEDEEDEIDENNLMDFTLPFAIKWGKIVRKVKSSEAKKIARKENYSEQDMKYFIYNKPKDAANAVIHADCHAHPSFFRAYVMPALLDIRIDDFGLFGKKLLSRLYLPRDKYVKVLRDGIGPELAKILGINIFPTFKRIQDTWQSIKMPLGNAPSSSAKSKTVLSILPEDDVDVPDDANDAAPANKTAGSSQSTAGRATDSLKRPGPVGNVQNDNNKRQRLDNADALKNTSQTKEGNKEQTQSSEIAAQKDASQSSEPNKGQKPSEADSSKKQGQDDKSQSAESNKSQSGKSDSTQASDKTAIPVVDLESVKNKTGSTSSTGVPEKESTSQPAADKSDGPNTDSVEPMSVDQEQDPKSSTPVSKGSTASSVSVEKSTCSTSSAQTTPKASCSADKPSTSTGDTSAKTCASAIIPTKATIYTSALGKKGASSVPLPATKGSPLFLIPVEKISSKLIEQFIQQQKGDGVKTRSSDKKKAKKPKQTSQVLVLIPSSNPNGSPTIQTLTSAEQLESTGDKKPLLLLPQDKVPKSIASQSQTVRRKMVITMVAPSSGATSGANSTVSTAQSASATTTSTSGGQSAEPTSAVQSVKGPIMSTQEGKTSSTSTDGNSDSSITPATASDSRESVDSSAKSLASVVNNTSALNSSAKDSSSSAGTGHDAGASESDSQASGFSTDKEAASNKENTTDGPATSEAPTSATTSGATDGDGDQSTGNNTGLDLLGSSMLPSDFTLDSLLKDIEGDGSGGEGNDMPPLDVSEIIRSFEDLPVESSSNTPANSTLLESEGDTGTLGDSSESANEIQMASSIQDRSSLQDEHDYAIARRQSPRRTPAASKSQTDAPDAEDEDGSKGDSDAEDGGPPRKRRKAPTRTSVRSSPQVTFVPDKEIATKSSQGSPAKAKGRKQ